tara:strand:- start:206 stop:910 length:705 start_codon:yes stop_codon:yes gene_type:complete
MVRYKTTPLLCNASKKNRKKAVVKAGKRKAGKKAKVPTALRRKIYNDHRASLFPEVQVSKCLSVDLKEALPEKITVTVNGLTVKIPRETLLTAIPATVETKCKVSINTADVHSYFTKRNSTLRNTLKKKLKKKEKVPDTSHPSEDGTFPISHIKDYGVNVLGKPEYTVVWKGTDKNDKPHPNTQEPPTNIHKTVLGDFFDMLTLSRAMITWRSLHKQTYPTAFRGNTIVIGSPE